MKKQIFSRTGTKEKFVALFPETAAVPKGRNPRPGKIGGRTGLKAEI